MRVKFGKDPIIWGGAALPRRNSKAKPQIEAEGGGQKRSAVIPKGRKEGGHDMNYEGEKKKESTSRGAPRRGLVEWQHVSKLGRHRFEGGCGVSEGEMTRNDGDGGIMAHSYESRTDVGAGERPSRAIDPCRRSERALPYATNLSMKGTV